MVKIDVRKLDIAFARQCKSTADLGGQVSLTTFQRIRSGQEVTPKTAGKIAKALAVDVSELLDLETKEEKNHERI